MSDDSGKPIIKIAQAPVVKNAPPKPGPVKDAKGRFLAGFAANPGGRPKVAEAVKKYAQEHSLEALELAYNVLKDANEKTGDRLAAARFIASAAGVMVQKVETNAPQNDPLREISADDLKKFLDGDKN